MTNLNKRLRKEWNTVFVFVSLILTLKTRGLTLNCLFSYGHPLRPLLLPVSSDRLTLSLVVSLLVITLLYWSKSRSVNSSYFPDQSLSGESTRTCRTRGVSPGEPKGVRLRCSSWQRSESVEGHASPLNNTRPVFTKVDVRLGLARREATPSSIEVECFFYLRGSNLRCMLLNEPFNFSGSDTQCKLGGEKFW